MIQRSYFIWYKHKSYFHTHWQLFLLQIHPYIIVWYILQILNQLQENCPWPACNRWRLFFCALRTLRLMWQLWPTSQHGWKGRLSLHSGRKNQADPTSVLCKLWDLHGHVFALQRTICGSNWKYVFCQMDRSSERLAKIHRKRGGCFD